MASRVFVCLHVSPLLPSEEATNHDRSRKSNGSLEETAVEVPSSPPRTTLLGTIFSPVFNFFSPAKNGRRRWLLHDSTRVIAQVWQ